VDEKFADHAHLKVRLGHAPKLAGFQGLLAGAADGLYSPHATGCALTFN
jgi:hypothetical protein